MAFEFGQKSLRQKGVNKTWHRKFVTLQTTNSLLILLLA